MTLPRDPDRSQEISDNHKVAILDGADFVFGVESEVLAKRAIDGRVRQLGQLRLSVHAHQHKAFNLHKLHSLLAGLAQTV